jgi:hypothetical protein
VLRLLEAGTYEQIVIGADGSQNDATHPSLAFYCNGNFNSGIFNNTGTELTISINSVGEWELGGDILKSNDTGGASIKSRTSQPVHSFTGDGDSGFGRIGIDNVGIYAGNVLIIEFTESTFDYSNSKVNTVYTPSSDLSLQAADAITPSNTIMRVVGNGGAVTLTSTPNIVDAVDGMIVIVQGTSDVNTVTLQDEGVLGGSGLDLGGANITLGNRDVLKLMYDSGEDVWIRMYHTNN